MPRRDFNGMRTDRGLWDRPFQEYCLWINLTKIIFDESRKKQGSEFGLFTKLESQCSTKYIMQLFIANGERQGAFTLAIVHILGIFRYLLFLNLRFK